LGQLLKLANLVASGSDVKAVLAAELVLVNGEIETRRGRLITPSDVVTVEDESITVATRLQRPEDDDG
jgi:ribosome-associated protein